MSLVQLSDAEYASLETYVDGTMPLPDREAWAEKMHRDPRLQKAYDELIELLKILKTSDLERTMRAKMAQWEQATVIADIDATSETTQAQPSPPLEPTRKKTAFPPTMRWIAAAAAVFAIAFGLWYFRPTAEQRLFDRYFVPDPRSQYTLGTSGADEARSAMGAYQGGKYDDAIPHFQAALAAQKTNDTLSYFLANALMAENRAAEALPHLDALAIDARRHTFKDMADWLRALCHLDAGDVPLATTILKQIVAVPDHRMRSQAQSLLTDLQ